MVTGQVRAAGCCPEARGCDGLGWAHAGGGGMEARRVGGRGPLIPGDHRAQSFGVQARTPLRCMAVTQWTLTPAPRFLSATLTRVSAPRW